jgi:hypothetical protein
MSHTSTNMPVMSLTSNFYIDQEFFGCGGVNSFYTIFMWKKCCNMVHKSSNDVVSNVTP